MATLVWKCPYPHCHFTTVSYALLKRHFSAHDMSPCPLCKKRIQNASSHFYFNRADPMHLLFYCLLKRNYNHRVLSGLERFKIAKEACAHA